MDFEIAAQRLAKDQKSALARSRASRNARAASSKARREAQAAKAKAEQRLREKKLESERNAKIVDSVVNCVRRVERKLGATNVVSSSTAAAGSDNTTTNKSLLFDKNPTFFAQGWKLQATSIHGEGDKIALPPSILETLTSNNSGLDPWGGNANGRPLAFRIGVLDLEYEFPASDKMKALVDKITQDVAAAEKTALSTNQLSSISSTVEPSNDEVMSEDSDDDDDDDTTTDETSAQIEAYLDELSHRYISYTHGTVVEFTQEDGCVGLPEPIARALLQQNSHSLGMRDGSRNNNSRIPIKRTVDPASTNTTTLSSKIDDDSDMDIVTTNREDEDAEKTPGHLAYGAFDVPDLPIEITPITSLPAGNDCTFTPTASSIKNGFYNLKDVKAVLEQSLMRTRATLSKGDVIRTWRRGVSFDLIVSSLSPSEFGVVSCVNTDLNVDIGPPDEDDLADLNVKPKPPVESKTHHEVKSSAMGESKGRMLSEDTQRCERKDESKISAMVDDLIPEPAADKVEGVCNVQIRGRAASGDSVTGRRRFDINVATLKDLFHFAATVCGGDPMIIRLVTRFPRRVFALSSKEEGGQVYANDSATLMSVGINQGQELFMIENM